LNYLNGTRDLPGSVDFPGVFLFLLQRHEQSTIVASIAATIGSAMAKALPVLFPFVPVNGKHQLIISSMLK